MKERWHQTEENLWRQQLQFAKSKAAMCRCRPSPPNGPGHGLGAAPLKRIVKSSEAPASSVFGGSWAMIGSTRRLRTVQALRT